MTFFPHIFYTIVSEVYFFTCTMKISSILENNFIETLSLEQYKTLFPNGLHRPLFNRLTPKVMSHCCLPALTDYTQM